MGGSRRAEVIVYSMSLVQGSHVHIFSIQRGYYIHGLYHGGHAALRLGLMWFTVLSDQHRSIVYIDHVTAAWALPLLLCWCRLKDFFFFFLHVTNDKLHIDNGQKHKNSRLHRLWIVLILLFIIANSNMKAADVGASVLVMQSECIYCNISLVLINKSAQGSWCIRKSVVKEKEG